MGMGLRFCTAILLSCGLASFDALAWDGHHQFTRYALRGFKTQAPDVWQKLNKPVQVTSLESFLQRVLGPTCTWEAARDNVFEGVGRDYKVYYTEGVKWKTYVDLRSANTWIKIDPTTDGKPNNPQGIGQWVTPLEVLSIYSDEPDWLIDDDVPRLKGKGLFVDAQGAATRVLRHFWWENEPTVLPLDFGKDQETNRRLQLFYELALVAFENGEPYWGYRFLGNAVHYIQDMTQPFHVQAIVHDDMVNTIGLWRGKLCDFQNWASGITDKPVPEQCKGRDLVNEALVQSAKVIVLYHALYEDFVRGVLDSKRYGASSLLADVNGYVGEHGDEAGKIARLPATEDSRGLVSFMGVPAFAQEQIRPLVIPVGKDVYKTFTNRFRYHDDELEKELNHLGQKDTFAYRLPVLQIWEQWELSEGQFRSRNKLIQKTGYLMSRLGVWSRQFLSTVMRNLGERQKAAVADIRTDMMRACAAGPNALVQ